MLGCCNHDRNTGHSNNTSQHCTGLVKLQPFQLHLHAFCAYFSLHLETVEEERHLKNVDCSLSEQTVCYYLPWMQWLSHCLFCLWIANIKVKVLGLFLTTVALWPSIKTLCIPGIIQTPSFVSVFSSPFSQRKFFPSVTPLMSSNDLLAVQKALVLSVWNTGVENFSATLSQWLPNCSFLNLPFCHLQSSQLSSLIPKPTDG